MTQSSIAASNKLPTFFPDLRSALMAGLTVAALLTASIATRAQTPATAPDAASQSATPAAAPQTTEPPSAEAQPQTINVTNQSKAKIRKQKDEKVVQSKDTKQEVKRYKKENPLQGLDAKLPDKQLYDKAMDAIKHGRYDVARLDLQTLLNTYQESQFQMRAKLAIADSWYREGGTAALTQAEQEFRDFITFFPNAPEAAEAQMRIGDIYFKEMDKPDRDNSKAVHAEQEYRLMLQQFPESERVPEAAQRLREVQESLASADADVAAFYASRLNWPATIARYQTVADTYPLYSHMDDVLVGLGDAYEAEARYYRTLKLPEAAKARLVSVYEGQAAAAWRKVVLDHSAAAHVEDARDRLAAMNLPIPTPTPEQAAASIALENSRGQYTLSNRVRVFILHQPDTVSAATLGAPPLEDPKPTLAPTVIQQTVDEFKAALSPAANAPPTTAIQITPVQPDATAQPAAPAPAPLAFQDVPSANGATPSPAVSMPATSLSPSSGGGTTMGIQIVPATAGSPAPATQPSSIPPAFPGATATDLAPSSTAPAPAMAAPAASSGSGNRYGALGPIDPATPTVLPPIEKAAPAPDPINDIPAGSQQPAQTAPANGKKKPKPAFDKTDESSSKHKKKKGVAKLNPF